MALIQGSDITTEAIIERFQSTVVQPILGNAYHAGNIPMCRGYQCVPTSMMDHLNNVNTTPDIGDQGDIVSAEVVLAGLIALVRNLTRVGSFTFTVNMRHTESGASYLNDPDVISAMNKAAASAAAASQYDGIQIDMYENRMGYDLMMETVARARSDQLAADAAIASWKSAHADDGDSDGKSWTTELARMSGNVIFTQAYIRTAFGAPGDKAGVVYGEIIKASNLNQLMANIYQHWYSYNRERYNGSAIVCHTSCHFNCHSNCHYNCHSACHGWTIIKNA